MMRAPALMKFDPAYGTPQPYPSEAAQYRAWHGQIAWLYNPYTGQQRDPRDIGSDVTGLLIVDADQPLLAVKHGFQQGPTRGANSAQPQEAAR